MAGVMSFQRPVAGSKAGMGRVAITTPDRATLLADIETHLASRQGFALATLNLDHLVKLNQDPAFLAAYLAQSHVVADGNPVVWLQRLAGQPVELIPGSELITPLCAIAARLGVPVGLLGSTQAVLDLAAQRLTFAHPGLTVVARLAPPLGFDPAGAQGEAALHALAAVGARLCFLALGAPKQEILAARGRVVLPEAGFVSIGAGLDFIAGAQVRAPVWVRKIAMEWAWRLMSNPGRLGRRYLNCALILPGLTLQARKDALMQTSPPRLPDQSGPGN